MSESKPTLRLRTPEQVALFDLEIRGQLSDGMWENTRPYDHWQPWCSCDVIVDVVIQGRNFWVVKDNYNLLSSDLLDVVGNRMMTYVKLVRSFGIKNTKLLSNLFDIEGNWRGMPTYSGEYWDKIRADILNNFPILENVRMAVLQTMSYTKKKLRADLREIKAAMKNDLTRP